ncbi:glycosyltransferase [Candidatus Gottesmanbacteria bacterium]|nr:glycosyltransferase [Candidatus Gottesmanbacteria bacterium]
MRIAFFTDAFLPQINGVVSYVVDVTTWLTKKGHTVIVYAPKPRRNFHIDVSQFPFRLVLLPSLPSPIYPDIRITIPSLPKILRDLKRSHIDVVHINDPWTVCMDGVEAAKLLRIPIVMTYHTFFLDTDMLKNIRFGKILTALRKPLSRLITFFHNYADVVICPSFTAQKELEKYGLKTATVVLPNGIDLSRIRRLKSAEIVQRRAEFGLSSKDFVGLYVGRLSADKSVDFLIRAWKNVVRSHPSAKLLLVGTGPKEKDMKKLVRMQKLQSAVFFAGSIERDSLLSSGLYSMADIFITASKIENQSIAMIEAMAHGLPIVAVDMRGSKELVDSTNGYLVPPDSMDAMSHAILTLMKSSKKRQLLRNGSLFRAKEFSSSTVVSKLEGTYFALSRGKKYIPSS